MLDVAHALVELLHLGVIHVEAEDAESDFTEPQDERQPDVPKTDDPNGRLVPSDPRLQRLHFRPAKPPRTDASSQRPIIAGRRDHPKAIVCGRMARRICALTREKLA